MIIPVSSASAPPRPRLLLAIFAAILLSCGSDTPPEPGVTGRIRPQTHPVAPDLINPNRIEIGRLDWLGGLHVSANDPRFGGWSGLHATADGAFMAISDRGYWWNGRFREGADGRLIGLEPGWLGPIPGPDGHPLIGLAGDCEEVHAYKGGWLLSFEREHRLWLYHQGVHGEPVPPIKSLPIPSFVKTLPDNFGMEAVTELPDDGFLIIAETRTRDGQYAWLRNPDGSWRERRYVPAQFFLATGAIALPDGRVFVIERYFAPSAFTARIVMIPPAALDADWSIVGTELARLEGSLISDNMEGITVTLDAQGRPVITIISDDNYFSLQRTLMLRFRCRNPACAE